MRTVTRLICIVVLAVLALAGATSPAQAKGPTDVAVEGPGVNQQLSYTRRTGDADIGTLGEAARIYELWDGRGLSAAPPLTPDELGPEFVLTWTVAEMHWATQYAYPFATGGAWVRHRTTEGDEGWARAPRLTNALVELGAVEESPQPVVAEQEPPVSASSASDPPAVSAEDDPWSPYGVAALGAGLAVAVATGVLVARRRRLSS